MRKYLLLASLTAALIWVDASLAIGPRGGGGGGRPGGGGGGARPGGGMPSMSHARPSPPKPAQRPAQRPGIAPHHDGEGPLGRPR